MDKLSFLLACENFRRRDTWQVYGGKIYNSTQTEFAKDDIFQIEAPGTLWDNSIVYCNKELHLTVSGGVAEVQTLSITHSAIATDTIAIMLDGISVSVSIADLDTPLQVATKIIASSFAGWTVSGSGIDVIFTSNTIGARTGAYTYTANTTGTTATFVRTVEGLADSSILWSDYVFDNQANGTIKNSLSIIHPNIYVILTGTQLLAITEPLDLAFIAFASLDVIDISDNELNKILIEVGVPFITLQELEYSRDDILNLMIKPAIDEYYKWFPILTVNQYPAYQAMIRVPIPPYAKVVQRAYINPGYPMTGNHLNPITRYFDEVVLSASSRGSFASPSINYRNRQPFADIQAYSTFLLEKSVRQGAINHGTRKRIRVEMINGFVTGYSNIQGVLEIEWGSCSYNWEHIPYNRVSEVRKLAKAYVLRALGGLRSQAKEDMPGLLNYETFMTRADKLEEEVMELWQGMTKVVVIRG